MRKNTIPLLTAGLCLLFLLAGLVRALISPDTEIPYENRPANRFPAFSAGAFLEGDYQSEAESALADQIPEAIRMKKLYNIFDAGLALPVIRELARDGSYVGFRDICFFGDMLTVRPFPLSAKAVGLWQSARRINDWAAAAPEVDFYVYYIETPRDIDLETGEKTGLYDFFLGELALPETNIGRLRLDSFADYRRLFFKTDHHWNAEGAWKGYCDLCAMLGTEPLPRLGSYSVPACYRGTRAAGVEGVEAEDFAVVLYELPDMTRTVYTGEISSYGEQARFVSGELAGVSYGAVFGGDYGELLFETGRPGKNLLVLGDSYDNALLEPLAAGFSKCCSVDLRAFSAETGHAFNMADYIREHEIDCVLFIAGIDYFAGILAEGEVAS